MTRAAPILNETVFREIDELAALKDSTVAEAIAEAVHAELERARDIEERRKQIRELIDRLHQLPVLGPMPTDADFYDEDGLPR